MAQEWKRLEAQAKLGLVEMVVWGQSYNEKVIPRGMHVIGEIPVVFLTFFLGGGQRRGPSLDTRHTRIYIETLWVHRPHVHSHIGLVEVPGQSLGCIWLAFLPLSSLWPALHRCGSLEAVRGKVAAQWSRPRAVKSAVELAPRAEGVDGSA